MLNSLPLRFPFSRPELLKEWVLNIGRGDFEPKQHTVICSEHFRPECFSAFGNRKNLKHNAVPTVFAFRDATQVNTLLSFLRRACLPGSPQQRRPGVALAGTEAAARAAPSSLRSEPSRP